MPKSVVRLSAGRQYMTDELQALCFVAGANSIFIGDVLLTTKNPQTERDANLLDRLGIKSQLDHAKETVPAAAACACRRGRKRRNRCVIRFKRNLANERMAAMPPLLQFSGNFG